MAQLDRATVCGTVGRRFESCWAHSFFCGDLWQIPTRVRQLSLDKRGGRFNPTNVIPFSSVYSVS